MKIQVTPEYLRERGKEWTALAGQVEKDWLGAAEHAEGLERYFFGGPAGHLREEFTGLKEEGIRELGVLKAHLAKLDEIALVYGKAERSNTDVATDD